MVADRWALSLERTSKWSITGKKKRRPSRLPNFPNSNQIMAEEGRGVPLKVDSGQLDGYHWWAAALGKVTRGALQCPGYHARGGKARRTAPGMRCRDRVWLSPELSHWLRSRARQGLSVGVNGCEASSGCLDLGEETTCSSQHHRREALDG